MVDSRNKVGECLADAGAGLDHQVAVLVYGFTDALEHSQLFGPVFVGREFLGQQALGPEYGLGIKHKSNRFTAKAQRLQRKLSSSVGYLGSF